MRRLQEHLKSHYTLGYYIIKDTLRNHNEHLRDTDEKDDEFGTFFRYYADQLYSLKPAIRERDPYDIADEIFDENRERFWSHLKLYDICEVYNYPTYFAIDRDICHGAAFRLAGELNLQLEPQTTAEVMHDLWDEARFKLSRSVKTEEMLEQLIAMGAEGIKAFAEIERLTEYLPKPPHTYSSDPSGVNTRFIKFEKLRAHDPDNQDLFALIAALFVRLDQAQHYPELLQQIRGLGEYARPPLEEIVANADLFADQQRGPIRDTSRQLLAEIEATENHH